MATKTSSKTYTIRTTRTDYRGNRPDRVNEYTGTLPELIESFSYTLEIGNSWNKRISRSPKTINTLVSHLQMSYEEKEGACYSRTSVELVK